MRFVHLYFCLVLFTHDVLLVPNPANWNSNSPAEKLNDAFEVGQHYPALSSEVDTCGVVLAPIQAKSARYQTELVTNTNANIIYKDSSFNVMSKKVNDVINILSLLVANEWGTNVKVRVLDAWRPDIKDRHDEEAFHSEGRAVDITTSDLNPKHYGRLARLAVIAGFDFVWFKDPTHVHCSCKKEMGNWKWSEYGCFPFNSLVRMSSGRLKDISDIQIGDSIVTADIETKIPQNTTVTGWLDFKPNATLKYVHISLSNKTLEISLDHLIFVRLSEGRWTEMFAAQLKPNDVIWLHETGASEIISVTIIQRKGAFAPLTKAGTLLVNDILVSCFAQIRSHWLGYISFLPINKLYDYITFEVSYRYAAPLWRISQYVLPEDYLYTTFN